MAAMMGMGSGRSRFSSSSPGSEASASAKRGSRAWGGEGHNSDARSPTSGHGSEGSGHVGDRVFVDEVTLQQMARQAEHGLSLAGHAANVLRSTDNALQHLG